MGVVIKRTTALSKGVRKSGEDETECRKQLFALVYQTLDKRDLIRAFYSTMSNQRS